MDLVQYETLTNDRREEFRHKPCLIQEDESIYHILSRVFLSLCRLISIILVLVSLYSHDRHMNATKTSSIVFFMLT
jgi:hypothetical protein